MAPSQEGGNQFYELDAGEVADEVTAAAEVPRVAPITGGCREAGQPATKQRTRYQRDALHETDTPGASIEVVAVAGLLEHRS
jgi:hypothetical protein